MNSKAQIVLMLVAALLAGLTAGRWWGSASREAAEPADGGREVLYWVAPMDAQYRRDAPGKSPMGMDLVPVYATSEDAAAADVVRIDPTVVHNLGVRTAAAQFGPLPQRIETVGHVSYDEDTLFHIHTRVEGWIESLAVKSVGEAVTRGQLLFELYSPTLVNAQEEYLAAIASGNRALREASGKRLAALGVTESDIRRLDKERKVEQRIRVFAQADGFVTELGVRQGVYLDPARKVMTIAALDQVWVLAQVFERHANLVLPGQQALVEVDFLPGQTRQGKVEFVYPELDPQSRTLTVRLRFDNADHALRPNMFARVSIAGDDSKEVVHVPREAVIRGEPHDRVVLSEGGGTFRAQPVTIGIESGDRVEIRSGVETGDLVVTSGQFLIDSEASIDAALARMQAQDPDHGDRKAPVDHTQMDHSGHDMDKTE